MNGNRRRSVAYLVAACATATALIGTAAPALASDGNCNGVNCLWLDGTGLHIDRMDASSLLLNGFYGYFHFWVQDWSYDSPTTGWPEENGAKVTPPDRQWPEHTLACSQGRQRLSNGTFEPIGGPACVTLHS